MSTSLDAYEARAIREAMESGMARSEVMATLGSLRVTDFVPPHEGEAMADYAARATGELMVRYLAQDDASPPV